MSLVIFFNDSFMINRVQGSNVQGSGFKGSGFCVLCSGFRVISAELFCKRVAFMPYGVVLKDERPTSNIEHRTSNNDVAPLLKLF